MTKTGVIPSDPVGRRYGRTIRAGLAAGAIAITINTIVLFAADWIPLVTAHGGLLKLIKPAASVMLKRTWLASIWHATALPAPGSQGFKAGFHITVGLGMAVGYALVIERLLPGAAWIKGVIYALAVWLANAFIVLPAIGEGIAGSRHLSLAGMVYFAVAHTIFFVTLAVLYQRFQPHESWHRRKR